MQMANAQEFFTPDAISHFATAVAAVIAVSRVVRHLCKAERPAVTFVIALMIAYLSAGASGTLSAVP